MQFINNKMSNQRWHTSPAAPTGGLGHSQTGMCMSDFMMIGWEWRRYYMIEISWIHVSMTLTSDNDLSVTEYPYSMCMLSFMIIGCRKWLRYYTLKFCENTDKHTDNDAVMGITMTSQSPYGGRGNKIVWSNDSLNNIMTLTAVW